MLKLLCIALWFLPQGASAWGDWCFRLGLMKVYESLRFMKVGCSLSSWMCGFDWAVLDEKVLNVMYFSYCPKAHQTYLTAYFQCFWFFFFFLVLLCHFQQQVLQCYCSAVSTDNGEYGEPWAHLCIPTSCVFKHTAISLGAAPVRHRACGEAVTAVPVLTSRECTLCPQCCWSAWACPQNIAPSSQRCWESCSSTSITAGLMSYSSSVPCPVSCFST